MRLFGFLVIVANRTLFILLHLANDCEQSLVGHPITGRLFECRQRVPLGRGQVVGLFKDCCELQVNLGGIEGLQQQECLVAFDREWIVQPLAATMM